MFDPRIAKPVQLMPGFWSAVDIAWEEKLVVDSKICG
jgi:hypothetical protein